MPGENCEIALVANKSEKHLLKSCLAIWTLKDGRMDEKLSLSKQ